MTRSGFNDPHTTAHTLARLIRSVIQQYHVNPPVAGAACFIIVTGDGKILTHAYGGNSAAVHTQADQCVKHRLGALLRQLQIGCAIPEGIGVTLDTDFLGGFGL